MAIEMLGRDLYLQVTDTEGRTHKNYHRVWDRDRFIQSQRDYWAKESLRPEATCSARVDVMTEDEYKA
jgi:hypothetical protein